MFPLRLCLLVFFVLVRNSIAYIEYVEVSSCENCTLMLTCRHLNSVIAVFNATFEPFNPNSIYYEDFNNTVQPVYPRFSLNRRCSGVNHCSFILTKDCPGADRWGPGNFTVKFACIAERRISKYCNDNITLPYPEVNGISEGFIRNPGYPMFYLGRKNCTWRIRAPPMQRIKITILDLSLIGVDNPETCLDLYEIKEQETTVFASCLEKEPPTEVVSLGDSLDITLRASESLTARRGVLFHYTAIGCLTPAPPKDGYLVFRNDTDAFFSCCVGFTFPDTLVRTKDLKCLGHVWNHAMPLPDCIKQTRKSDLFTRELKKPQRDNMTASLSEVVVPSIIIIALFVINSIILFVIYKYKKRKTALYTEEELGTIAIQSINGGNNTA